MRRCSCFDAKPVGTDDNNSHSNVAVAMVVIGKQNDDDADELHNLGFLRAMLLAEFDNDVKTTDEAMNVASVSSSPGTLPIVSSRSLFVPSSSSLPARDVVVCVFFLVVTETVDEVVIAVC